MIVFDNMTADMLSSKKLNRILTKLENLNISVVYIMYFFCCCAKNYYTKFYTFSYENSKEMRASTNSI